MRLERPLLVFDLETTGLDVERDRIVELAYKIVRPDGTALIDTRRFHPGRPIPPAATRIHGITDEDVCAAPRFEEVAAEFVQRFEACDLAGFNVLRFDLPMLLAEFDRAGVAFDVTSRRLVDVCTIFHKKEPRSLAAAHRFYCGSELENAHRALADVEATHRVLEAQLERYVDLVRTPTALDVFCRGEDALDLQGLVRQRDGEAVLTFGPHRDIPLARLARERRDYLEELLKRRQPRDVHGIVRAFLDGEDVASG